MSTPLRPVVTACLLAGLTLVLYVNQPARQQTPDEAVFAREAASALSQPALFFHVDGPRWLQPMAVYAGALLRPFGGDSGRIASAVMGAVNVGLIFYAALLLYQRYSLAVSAALLLMSMPAHWWFAQQGTDAVFSTPFVLAWLIALLRFFETDSTSAIALAGAALAAGVLSNPLAPLTMAWLLVMSLGSLFIARRFTARAVLAVTLAFAIVLAPVAVYFALHPDAYPDTFGRWAVLKAHLRFPLDGLRAQMNWTTLANRASLFWGLFDPSFLFFAPQGQPIAPLLAVCAVLLPLGCVRALHLPWRSHRLLLFSILFVPPVIASTFGVGRELGAVVPMTVAVTLLSVAGLESWTTQRLTWKFAGIAAVLITAYQLTALL